MTPGAGGGGHALLDDESRGQPGERIDVGVWRPQRQTCGLGFPVQELSSRSGRNARDSRAFRRQLRPWLICTAVGRQGGLARCAGRRRDASQEGFRHPQQGPSPFGSCSKTLADWFATVAALPPGRMRAVNAARARALRSPCAGCTRRAAPCCRWRDVCTGMRPAGVCAARGAGHRFSRLVPMTQNWP